MTLHAREAAALLQIPEETLFQWIEKKDLPHHKIGNQYRFDRAELLTWATERRHPLSARIVEESEAAQVPTLREALRAGGIHYGVKGRDRASVLRSVVNVLPVPAADREFLFRVLEARESLGSTAIGDGIAIPHARHPIALDVPRPLISLCYLESPLDMQAGDGRPVWILFTIVSPTVKTHLGLLSRLAAVLLDGDFGATVKAAGSREEILREASRVDSHLLCGRIRVEERRS